MLVTNVRTYVQIGDFVGWADTWSDEEGCDPAGIIIERENDQDWSENQIWFLILMQATGKMSWEHDEDLVVMFRRAKLLDEK